VNIVHTNGHPEIIFTHHDVDGNILFEYKPEV
jgi:hypothetical protein